MMEAEATATRQDLLISLISQLQADHDLAVSSGNVSAAVTASKAIADLLSVKEETTTKPANPFADMDEAALEERIRQTAASLRSEGLGHLFDGVEGEAGADRTGGFTSRSREDNELATRLLALLRGKQ